MSSYKEVTIRPQDIENCTIYQLNIALKQTSDALIRGIIYNQFGRPIPGAVIEVIVINRGKRAKWGYMIANEQGEYAIVVGKSNVIDYQLNIYEPLTAE